MTEGRYKKILVPLDGSVRAQRAIPHAVDVARSSNSELILVHVLHLPAGEYPHQIALAGQDERIEAARTQIARYLDEMQAELHAEDLSARIEILEGADVPTRICQYIADEGIDLVVMSTRGHTGIARLLFGSVARAIMQCTGVPVLLIQPDRD